MSTHNDRIVTKSMLKKHEYIAFTLQVKPRHIDDTLVDYDWMILMYEVLFFLKNAIQIYI